MCVGKNVPSDNKINLGAQHQVNFLVELISWHDIRSQINKRSQV